MVHFDSLVQHKPILHVNAFKWLKFSSKRFLCLQLYAMPIARREGLQLGILLLAVPAQYIISQWMLSTESHRSYAIKRWSITFLIHILIVSSYCRKIEINRSSGGFFATLYTCSVIRNSYFPLRWSASNDVDY